MGWETDDTQILFEALDGTLRDIMRVNNKFDLIFGDNAIIFGGDFRKILLIIPRGSLSDVVHVTINTSYLWDQCQVLTLTKNMHLQGGLENTITSKLRDFSKWMLKIGDGNKLNDGFAEIDILEEFLITNFSDLVDAIVRITYPGLLV